MNSLFVRAVLAFLALPGVVAWPLALYAMLVASAVHVRILLHEEPWLARTFGDAYEDSVLHSGQP